VALHFFFSHNFETRRAPTTRMHASSTVWECEIVWRAHDASGAGGCYFVLLLLFLSSVRGIILYCVLLYLIGRKPVTPPRDRSLRNIKKYPVLLFYPNTIRLRCVQFFSLSLVVYARRESGNTVPAFCIIKLLYFLLSSHVYYNVFIILLLCGRIKANTDAAHLHFLSSSSTALMYLHNNSKYSE